MIRREFGMVMSRLGDGDDHGVFWDVLCVLEKKMKVNVLLNLFILFVFIFIIFS